MFWPTFTCQILIKFSFLESLWHKVTNCTSFAKKIAIFCRQPVKGNLHIFSFSWLKIRLFKIYQNFCIFEMAWSRAFQKCIIFHFLENFFLQTFLLCIICHIWTSSTPAEIGLRIWEIEILSNWEFDKLINWEFEKFRIKNFRIRWIENQRNKQIEKMRILKLEN